MNVAGRRGGLPDSSRYSLLAKIAVGGMATVYVGAVRGAGGFWKLRAIKRAHEHLLEQPEFREMLAAEARVTAHVHHPNVVSIEDVEEHDGELLLVMEYVEGETLGRLATRARRRGVLLPPEVAVQVGLDACAGLQAAHDAKGDDGEVLNIVHRDVSPQNIIVGVDGHARVLDFGIAKASGSISDIQTTTGLLKGKIAYMAPEYIEGHPVDGRADQFSLAVVLWETLTGRRLFKANSDPETMKMILRKSVPSVSDANPRLAPFDEVFGRALDKSPSARYPSMAAFARSLKQAAQEADLHFDRTALKNFVNSLAERQLAERRDAIRAGRNALDAEEIAELPNVVEAPGTRTAVATVTSRYNVQAPSAWGSRLLFAAVAVGVAVTVFAVRRVATNKPPSSPPAAPAMSTRVDVSSPTPTLPTASAAPTADDSAAPTATTFVSPPVSALPVRPVVRPRPRPAPSPSPSPAPDGPDPNPYGN